MCKNGKAIAGLLVVIGLACCIPVRGKKGSGDLSRGRQRAEAGPGPVLWRRPADISARNLFWGPGGSKNAPRGTFTFITEDLNGTNPKFDVRDQNGVKWKVKLGEEARAEVVATRLVWAVGYSANEDYFLPELRVEGMPARLHRGQNLVAPDGSVHNVRLKRHLEGEKKIAEWRWRRNPFASTRELNGLRVMMALINNWDLKDENNSIYTERQPREEAYLVSDLGASFGTTGRSWTRARSKGNLAAYSRSRFIARVTPEYVDFNVPTRPAMIWLFNPKEFFSRVELRWIGKRIPRGDVTWIGQLLAELSPGQIEDAFRAAGYSAEDVRRFAGVVEDRISELNDLPRD